MRPLGVISLLGLVACEGPFVPPPQLAPPPAQAAFLQITPDSATVIVDDTVRLRGIVRDSAGHVLTDRYLFWWNLDATIASVDGVGLVSALSPGRATVHLQVDDVVDSAALFVVPYVFTAIATGGNHTCAAANNARAYCWGVNAFGQVGTGTTSFVEATARLTLLPPPVVAVAAGSTHSCGLDGFGVASCWGDNGAGALGRGNSLGDPLQPTPVASSLRFRLLALGVGFSCGVTTTDAAACWGGNASGQLGTGSTSPTATPLPVLADVASLSAGAQHTCAITHDGSAWCWGANGNGQLGDSSTTAVPVPTAVVGGLTFQSISAGGLHSCALTPGRVAYCWGGNSHGESGSGLPDAALIAPTAVAGGLRFLQISAGGNHTCGIGVDSLAYCWGANTTGQLGDSSTTDRPTPVPVSLGLRFAQIATGGGFSCGITGAVVAYCWGDGTSGQLGTPQLGIRITPTRVAGQ